MTKKKESAASEKLKKRSKEIAEKLAKGSEIKELKEVKKEEKPLQEVDVLSGKEAIVKKSEAKKVKERETPKKPVEGKKVRVKDIEKVEQEIAKKEEEKEAGKVYSFVEGVKRAKSFSKKRKFTQTWDLAINLKGMNLKRPENRFSLDYSLPAGRGKEAKVGVIADTLATEAKKQGADVVITKEEIDFLAKDKKKLKKIANEVDWFYGEVSLMPLIGKRFGAVLGPRGKVPKPIPPKAAVGLFIKRARNMVRVALKESPVIHLPVGSEGMEEEGIVKNIEGVYGFVKEKLPKGVNNIRSMYIKLTMGKSVKLEVK